MKTEHYFQEIDYHGKTVGVDMVYYNTYRVLRTDVSMQLDDQKDVLVFVHTVELL